MRQRLLEEAMTVGSIIIYCWAGVGLFGLIGYYRGKFGLAARDSFRVKVTYYLLSLAGIASVYLAVSQPSFRLWDVMPVLVALTCAVGFNLSISLLANAPELTREFSKTWVKALDFPYLALGFVGLARVVSSSPKAAGGRDDWDAIGMVALSIAIGIRLSKSIIEVFFEKKISECG